MQLHVRDRIAGAVLLAVSLVWIVLVFQTIEPSQSTAAGPRAFPLFFGLALASMSAVLIAQSFFAPGTADDADVQATASPNETSTILATIGALAGYAFILEPLGFIPSTIIAVAGIMTFILRIRSPLQIAAMSLGLPLGCYLVFNKLLGTYLPPGTIITIYF